MVRLVEKDLNGEARVKLTRYSQLQKEDKIKLKEPTKRHTGINTQPEQQ